MTRAIFVLFSMLLGACGARSATDPSVGGMAPGGKQVSDSGPTAPKDHGVTPADAHLPAPLDAAPTSCLPAPASFMAGNYSGEWKGTAQCPPLFTNVAVFGLLDLELVPTTDEAFEVFGVMSGSVGPLDFSTELNGEMICVDLKATMEEFHIGNVGIVINLDGTMTATYQMPGNIGGQWNAKQQGGFGNCTLDGPWYANKDPS